MGGTTKTDMKKGIAVLICLIFLAGCSNIRWVKLEAEGAGEISRDKAADREDSATTKIFGDETETTIDSEEGDRIDVVLGVESAEIYGTIDGIAKRFSAPYTDKDAIVFDVAKGWGKKVYQVRGLVYFNGEPYSIKALEVAKEEKANEDEKNVEAFNISSIPLIKEYETGIVRAIGCSLEQSILRLKLANEGAKELPMFRDVLPRIKGALVVYLNNRLLELHCADNVAPGQIIDCIKTNVKFATERTGTVINPNAEFNQPDILAISVPGKHEQFTFKCIARTITIS